MLHSRPWAECPCIDKQCAVELVVGTQTQSMSNIGIRRLDIDSGYMAKYCHRCYRLLRLCTCRSQLTETRKLSEEADKRDKRITDLEEQVESFEQLVADLMVTVKSLNDRINKWPAK